MSNGRPTPTPEPLEPSLEQTSNGREMPDEFDRESILWIIGETLLRVREGSCACCGGEWTDDRDIYIAEHVRMCWEYCIVHGHNEAAVRELILEDLARDLKEEENARQQRNTQTVRLPRTG